jgi:hypothetical protein
MSPSRLIPLGLAAALAAALSTSPVVAAEDPDARAAASRAAIQEFAQALQGELKGAMKAGGPTNAIAVCKDKAPAIAADISTAKGWDVARTSLKLRNPDNAPDAWELAVMESFEQRKAAGEPLPKIDHAEITEVEGKPVFRYMKAIPTQGVCIACHGATVDPSVEQTLQELYPEDAARGFSPGDIRGAFTIVQPL